MKTSSIFKIFLLISFLVFSFFSFGKIKAGTEHNISGWAWSDNIGWISFNNTTDGSSVNYGVNVDTSTGLFSGYAWSDNIGWISFNRSDTGNPPAPPYNGTETFVACLDFPGAGQSCDGVGDYKVSGWTRTVNTGDGWDGWIKLRDDAVYADGVSLNDLTNQFEGWAWSDDFGWISFNCLTDGTCATSDYRLNYSPPPNNPPVLDWTGDSGYVSDGLDPETGDTSTNFNYRIKYTDQDGDAPNFVRVYIKEAGVDIVGSPFDMNFVSGGGSGGSCDSGNVSCGGLGEGNCANCGCTWLFLCFGSPPCSDFDESDCEPCGCTWTPGTSGPYSAIYSYTTTLSLGTDYTYYFEAQDSQGADAVPTIAGDAPDVIAPNNPPTAAFHCDPTGCGTSGCNGYTKCTFTLVNDSDDPEGQSDIASSTWIITGAANERITCTVNPRCDWPLQHIHSEGIYTAVLKVEDQAGATHTSDPQNFTILQDAIADFRCSLDSEGPWSDCNGFGLSEGEVIYFNSADYSSPSDPGSGTSIISWSWTFVDGTPPTSNLQNSSSIFEELSPNSGEITLTITDTAGRSNTTIPPYELIIKPPPPEWKEVSPF